MLRIVQSHKFFVGGEPGDRAVHSPPSLERADKLLLGMHHLPLQDLGYPNLRKLSRYTDHGDLEARVFFTQVSRVQSERGLAVGGGGMHGGKVAANDRGRKCSGRTVNCRSHS